MYSIHDDDPGDLKGMHGARKHNAKFDQDLGNVADSINLVEFGLFFKRLTVGLSL